MSDITQMEIHNLEAGIEQRNSLYPTFLNRLQLSIMLCQRRTLEWAIPQPSLSVTTSLSEQDRRPSDAGMLVTVALMLCSAGCTWHPGYILCVWCVCGVFTQLFFDLTTPVLDRWFRRLQCQQWCFYNKYHYSNIWQFGDFLFCHHGCCVTRLTVISLLP